MVTIFWYKLIPPSQFPGLRWVSLLTGVTWVLTSIPTHLCVDIWLSFIRSYQFFTQESTHLKMITADITTSRQISRQVIHMPSLWTPLFRNTSLENITFKIWPAQETSGAYGSIPIPLCVIRNLHSSNDPVLFHQHVLSSPQITSFCSVRWVSSLSHNSLSCLRPSLMSLSLKCPALNIALLSRHRQINIFLGQYLTCYIF